MNWRPGINLVLGGRCPRGGGREEGEEEKGEDGRERGEEEGETEKERGFFAVRAGTASYRNPPTNWLRKGKVFILQNEPRSLRNDLASRSTDTIDKEVQVESDGD